MVAAAAMVAVAATAAFAATAAVDVVADGPVTVAAASASALEMSEQRLAAMKQH